MIKLSFSCLLLFIFCYSTKANVNYININKITSNRILRKNFDYIKSNIKYYEKWTPDWKFKDSKIEVIDTLFKIRSAFLKNVKPNTEVLLLLGDISHYLYNMDAPGVFPEAINYYEAAIKSDSKDVRGHWFLGNHYSLANLANKGFEQFIIAQKMPLGKYSDFFWKDYAYSSILASMPSTALYALKNVNKKESGQVESDFKEIIDNSLIELNIQQKYAKSELWQVKTEDFTTIVSKPLGMKILIDTSWKVNLMDYSDNRSGLIVMPPRLFSKEGTSIGYSFVIIAYTSSEGKDLDSVINEIIKKNPDKRRVIFPTNIDAASVAWETTNPNLYTNMGGSHALALGIKRAKPQHPGLLIEQPVLFKPDIDRSKIVFNNVKQNKKRFSGEILYIILLDSCEAIYSQSLTVFQNFLRAQFIIE